MAELSNAADKAGAAKRLAESAAEEVVEVAKEHVARNHVTWMWGGFAVGAALGAGGGFYAARRYLEPKYKKISEDEISEMREHYRKRMIVREEKPDLNDLHKRVEDLGYNRGEKGPIVKPSVPVDPPPPGTPNMPVSGTPDPLSEVRKNVFDAAKDASEGWDYEVEKAVRKEGGTYVIHQDEFGETDNNEVTLSYYAGDDVLCDANDRIVDNQDRLVGDCLDKFGHGSGDRNVVYIRNEALAVDLEVIKSDKTYAEEVHGFKHEDPPRKKVPKYRE